jgi:lysophospholipase L1-like esterase
VKIIITLIVILLVIYGLRALYFVVQAGKLLATATTFPVDYYVGSPDNPVVTYVVLGDSTAKGQGASRLEKTYPYQFAQAVSEQGFYVHVLNYAVSGATTQQVLEDQLSQVATTPDYITVSVGANDATHRTSLEAYKLTTQNLLDQLETYKAKLFFATSPDLSLPPALAPIANHLANNRTKQQNDILKTLVGSRAIALIDIYAEAKLDSKINSAYYAADRFHPGDAGYARWATAFVDKLSP